jgi:hypothetical protein
MFLALDNKRLFMAFSASGSVAQLVEHLLCKQRVIGSNPFRSTIKICPVGVFFNGGNG